MGISLLMGHISKASDNTENVIGVFADFPKEFDTINRYSLLRKLTHY